MIYESEVLTKENVSKLNNYFDNAPVKQGRVRYGNGKDAVDLSVKIVMRWIKLHRNIVRVLN